MNRLSFFAAVALFVFPTFAEDKPTRADQELTEYFRVETAALSQASLADVTSLEFWKTHREEYRHELQDMLGLWPMPERTDLKPAVTGKLEREDFTVEKISFQASPGLYCTANLYLPKNLSQPAPAILYACGHARSATNGISFGNKAVYQSDGAWFARNGYVCLVLDTLQLGEIPGTHTGTRDKGFWSWNSRGYTPAGVEAWFGIRALDYLSTRPEVDANRLGVTGHSGGGAYSWTITALDDRIKAAAPLAGMADVDSHILDGVIDSHCDCNFFVNYRRWDFPQVAALAAPRPLLIGGTDNDRLFNLPNTQRIHEQVRRIYQLYDATNKLALAIAPGPHEETPELQLAVLRWFNRHLKGVETPIETVAKKFFTPAELKVFGTLPADAINLTIADTFVPQPKLEHHSPAQLRTALLEKVFGGWPREGIPLEPQRLFSTEREGLHFMAWDFTSQNHVRLRLYLLENSTGPRPAEVTLTVLDQASWTNWLADFSTVFAGELKEEISAAKAPGSGNLAKWKTDLNHTALAFFAPRGVGLEGWSGDEKAQTKIRRRFMLLGQTVDGMRVWDIRRAVQAIHEVREDDRARVELRSQDLMAANALYAALFEPNVKRLHLERLPASHLAGPDYLGVLKVCDIPQVAEAVKVRTEINSQ